MAYNNDFPFVIREVATILNLTIRYGKTGNGNMDVDCPFCNGKGKMNLNVFKNVFRCNYCGEYGGMVGLYGRIHGISNSEAFKEICELLGCAGQNPVDYGSHTPAGRAATLREAPPPPKRADAHTIHQTYSMMLKMLTLANPHRDNLLSRGLSADDIARQGYKSAPTYGHQGLCEKLMAAGCVIKNVPGFFKVMDEVNENGVKTKMWTGKWNIKLNAAGILIPIIGIDGKIAAIQIRLNKPFDGRKYIWLSSSDMEGGASSGAPIHFVGDPTAKRIFITEGGLKGNVAHTLSGHSFACVAGANNLGRLDALLAQLKANGVEEVVEALDMDKVLVYADSEHSNEEQAPRLQAGNIHIANAAQSLRDKIMAYGFKMKSAQWPAAHNGIDDYYFNRREIRRFFVVFS